MPVEAITAVGPEWNVAIPDAPGVDQVEGAGASKGFGGMLADQVGNLTELQTDAAAQSKALATGQAEDASQVVMAVERAQLSMQLAANLRDKSLEAFQDVFRTQV